MFEGVVSNLLTTYLGEYIENVDSNSLSISILKGNLDLYDLKLRKTALEGFNLPVTVIQGILGHLRLSIPWTQLESKPVIAEVSDLYLVVKPKKDMDMSEEERVKMDNEIKQKQLKIFETLRGVQKKSGGDEDEKKTKKKKQEEEASSAKTKKKSSGSSPTLVQKITEKIINNIQIKIFNIHARFEDVSDSNQRNYLGFTLKEFVIESSNEKWEKTFIKELKNPFIYKLAEVKGLSCYMNCIHHNNNAFNLENIMYSNMSTSEIFRQQMKGSLSEGRNKDYIVQPIDGKLKVSICQEANNFKSPKYKIDFEFNRFSMKLNDLQYKSFLKIVEYMSNYSQIEQFSRFRPRCDLSTPENRKQWLYYIMKANMTKVKENYYTTQQLLQRKADQIKFIDLFKRKKGVAWLDKLTEKETAMLGYLEKKLSIDDIMFYRNVADQQLKQEKKRYKQLQQEKTKQSAGSTASAAPAPAPKSSSSSWFSWGKKSTEETLVPQFTLTQEDKERLFKSIGYVEEEESANGSEAAAAVPPNYVVAKINFTLKNGDIKVIDSATRQSLLELEFRDFLIEFRKKQESFQLHMELGVFEIYDKFTKNTVFNTLLYKPVKKELVMGSVESRLLALDIESNPPNGKSDLYVNLFVDEVNLVLNLTLLQRMLSFFMPPNDINLSNFTSAAKKRLTNLKQQANTLLKIALENKKVIALDLYIKSPKIIIPDSLSSSLPTSFNPNLFYIDLGNLSIQSEVDKVERDKRLKSQQFIESDFYDQYKFNMTDIQLLTTDLQTFKAANVSKFDKILSNTSFELLFDLCLTPTNHELTRTRLKAAIPSVQFHLSPSQFDLFLIIMNQLYQVIQNPTGTSNTLQQPSSPTASRRVDKLLIKGVDPVKKTLISSHHESDYLKNEWTKYAVELNNDSKKLNIYDESNRLMISISINQHVQIKPLDESETYQEGFTLVIPQKASKYHYMAMCFPSKQSRHEWQESIRQHIINDTSKRPEASSPSSAADGIQAVGEEDDDDDDEGVKSQIQLKTDFRLGEFSFVLHYESNDVVEVKLNELIVDVCLRKYDKSIKVDLQRFEIVNLLKREAILCPKLQSTNSLASFKMIMVDKESPLLSNYTTEFLWIKQDELKQLRDAPMLLELDFDSIIAKFDPSIIAPVISFGFDISRMYSALPKSKMKNYVPFVEAASSSSSSPLTPASDTLESPPSTPSKSSSSSGNGGEKKKKKMQMVVHVNGLEFGFVHHTKQFCKLDMKKSVLELSLYKDKIDFKGVIGNVVGEDFGVFKEQSVKYNQILGLSNPNEQSLITFQYTQSLNPVITSISYQKHFKAVMHSVKFVYLMKFINYMTYYFSHNQIVQVVQKNTSGSSPSGTIKSAATKKAPSTTSGSTSSSSHHQQQDGGSGGGFVAPKGFELLGSLASLVELDIELVNPKIVVPNGYKKDNLVIGDLGNIKLYNKINQRQDGQVEDIYYIDIKDMNITSQIQEQVDNVVNNVQLNFQFARAVMIQSMAESRIPDLDFAFKSSNIDLQLSRIQYELIFDIIKHNVMDWKPITFRRTNSTNLTLKQLQERQKEMAAKEKEQIMNSMSGNQSTSAAAKMVYLTTKVNVQIPRVSLTLLRGTGKDEQGLANPLTNMQMNTFELTYAGKSDKSFLVDIRVLAVNATDQRKESTSVFQKILSSTQKMKNKLLKESTSSSSSATSAVEEKEHFVVFTYEKTRYEDQLIDLFMKDPKFIFVPDFVVELKNFTMVPKFFWKKNKLISSLKKKKNKNKQQQQQQVATAGDEEDDGEEEGGVEDVEEPPKGKLCVTAQLSNSQLIFPEDATNNQTRLLVAEFSADLKYVQQKEDQSDQGTFQLHQFTIYVSSHNTKVKNAPILEPFSFNVELLSYLQNKSLLQREVILATNDNLNTKLVYHDVKLINTVVQTFIQKQADLMELAKQGSEASAAEEDAAVTEDPNLVQDKDDKEEETDSSEISDESSSFETPTESQQLIPSATALKKKKKKKEKPLQDVVVQFVSKHKISILLVDDIRGYDIPLIQAFLTKLELRCSVSTGSQGQVYVEVAVPFSLYAAYYNLLISDWEPLIEPFDLQVMFKRVPHSHATTPAISALDAVDGDSGGEGDSGGDEIQYKNEILVSTLNNSAASSNNTLNVNLSKNMIDTVLTTSKLWMQGLKGEKILSTKFDPFLIRNETGMEVTLEFTNKEEAKETHVIPTDNDFGFAIMNRKNSINLSIKNKLTLDISVNKIGTTKYLLEKGVNPLLLVVEIEQLEGKKVIVLRSGVEFVNYTDLHVDIALYSTIQQKIIYEYLHVEPNHRQSVPLVDIQDVIFLIKPSSPDYSYSTVSKTCNLHSLLFSKTNYKNLACKVLKNNSSSSSSGDDGYHYFVLDIQHFSLKTSRYHHGHVQDPLSSKELHNLYDHNYLVKIQAPLALENLLYYDYEYTIFERSKEDGSNKREILKGTLKVGEKVYLYRVNIKNTLLLKNLIRDGVLDWQTKEVALINLGAFEDVFKARSLSKQVALVDPKNMMLLLNLDYVFHSNQAYREVTIFTSYWIQNRSGLDNLSILFNPQLLTGTTLGAGQSLLNHKDKMLMFSFPNTVGTRELSPKDHKICLLKNSSGAAASSAASRLVNISNVGISDEVELKVDKDKYNVGMYTELGPAKFKRTKIITFNSRFVLINKTKYPLNFKTRSEQGAAVYQVPSNQHHNFYQYSSLTIQLDKYHWSSPFNISSLDDTPIKLLKADSSRETLILTANILYEKGSTFIIISETGQSPYVIYNHLKDYTVQICQQGSTINWDIMSLSKYPYSWDQNNGTQKLTIRILKDNQVMYSIQDFNINKIDTKPVKLTKSLGSPSKTSVTRSSNKKSVTAGQQQDAIYLNVIAKGPTRMLHISDRLDQQLQEDVQEVILVQLETQIKAIGLSIIDDTPKELIYIHLQDIQFKFSQTNKNRYIMASLSNLQVDHQSMDAMYPVILSRKPTNPATTTATTEPLPFIQFSFCQNILFEKANRVIQIFPYFSINIQEFNISLDYMFILRVSQFAQSIVSSVEKQLLRQEKVERYQEMIMKGWNEQVDNLIRGHLSFTRNKFYFNNFELHPIKCNITFKFNKLSTSTTTSSSKEESTTTSSSSSYSSTAVSTVLQPVNIVLESLGITFANIEEAPIKLNSLILNHLFCDQKQLIDKLKQHYIRSVTIEFYKIIGSLDFIGNPIGLVNDLSTGIKDFFYEPASAIVKSPDQLSESIIKGSQSLYNKTIHGTFNTASKVGNFVGKSLRLLTLDDDYIKQGVSASGSSASGAGSSGGRAKPKDLKEGLTQGSEALVKNIFQSASDLVTKPIEGAKEEGTLGFVKNLGIAIIGIPTKPIVGLVDFATKTTEGISNTTKVFTYRVRFPRAFRADDNALTVYSEFFSFTDFLFFHFSRTSAGAELVHHNEKALHHCYLSNNVMMLLTTRSIFIIKLTQALPNLHDLSANVLALEWYVPLKQIVSIAKELPTNSIVIQYVNPKVATAGSGAATTTSSPSKNLLGSLSKINLTAALKSSTAAPATLTKKVAPHLVNKSLAEDFYIMLLETQKRVLESKQ